MKHINKKLNTTLLAREKSCQTPVVKKMKCREPVYKSV